VVGTTKVLICGGLGGKWSYLWEFRRQRNVLCFGKS